MADTKPRDLTVVELELLGAPAVRSPESRPLAVPPGMLTPVSLLDPAADSVSSGGAPTAEPPEATGSRRTVVSQAVAS
jgi:hypothetical protein